MNKEEHNDMLYHLSVAVAKRLYKKGVITFKEFEAMHCILLEKYHPIIEGIITAKDLIN